MRVFFDDEGGFTQVGVIMALLLSLALLVTSVQVYRTESTAGEIQFAADAGALAAENVVAEYYVVARAIDAAILSVSLLALTVIVVALVVTVVPGGQAVGAKLLDAARHIVKFRDSFARTCGHALEATEKVLTFLAAIDAAEVIGQNSTPTCSYRGFAVIMPLTGESTFPADETDEALDELDQDAERVHEQSAAALQADADMKDSKERAYQEDCGAAPGYCQYERADTLAGLPAALNPRYASADLWSFDVALERARAYYDARLGLERPEIYGDAELGESVARRALYAYAVERLQGAYAYLDGDGVLQASFPTLPHNSAQIRETHLYTDADYPVSSDGILHASAGCSGYQEAGGSGWESVADVESGTYRICPRCNFSTATLGKTAAISHNAANGFEYHYEIIAEEAARYAESSRTYEKETRESKDALSDAMDTFKEAADKLLSGDARIVPKPPGRAGCVAVAVDTDEHTISDLVSMPFVRSSATLRKRVAVSAAQLVEEPASEDETFITSMLDGFAAKSDEGNAIGALVAGSDTLLSLWSASLSVYRNGIDGFAEGVENVINAIPLIGSTSLGSWAREKFLSTVDDLGFSPPELGSPKAVTVNTEHVLSASGHSLDTLLSETPVIGDTLSQVFGEYGLGTLGFLSEELRRASGGNGGGWS